MYSRAGSIPPRTSTIRSTSGSDDDGCAIGGEHPGLIERQTLGPSRQRTNRDPADLEADARCGLSISSPVALNERHERSAHISAPQQAESDRRFHEDARYRAAGGRVATRLHVQACDQIKRTRRAADRRQTPVRRHGTGEVDSPARSGTPGRRRWPLRPEVSMPSTMHSTSSSSAIVDTAASTWRARRSCLEPPYERLVHLQHVHGKVSEATRVTSSRYRSHRSATRRPWRPDIGEHSEHLVEPMSTSPPR